MSYSLICCNVYADDILNMNPLDMSVNRSLGVQIKNAIKDYPDGTVFGQFTIK